MAQVGYQKVVNIKTTASTAYSVMPANAASLNMAGEMLDDTDFTSTGWRSRVRGLKDYSVSATLFWGSTDAAVNTMRDALLSGASLDLQYLPNGTKGFQARVIVESFANSGDVGGLETVEVSLQSQGQALTTV